MTYHPIGNCDCCGCRHARAERRDRNGGWGQPNMIAMLDSPYWRRSLEGAPADCPQHGTCRNPKHCGYKGRCIDEKKPQEAPCQHDWRFLRDGRMGWKCAKCGSSEGFAT